MYVTVTGEGRDVSMPGEAPRMQFTASLKLKKDSKELKEFQAKLEKIWEEYKAVEPLAKGTLTYGSRSKCSGIKPVMVEVDDKTDIDPETDKVRKVESDEVLITAKTNTTYPKGNPKVVRIYAPQADGNGLPIMADVTEKIAKASWSIGNGSLGILHIDVVPNTIGGKAKLTFYLVAVQLSKLVKYEGDAVELVPPSEDDVPVALDDDIPEI